MKSRQQLRAQVVSGSNASEGLLAQLFTLVAHVAWVRSGIQLTTKKEMIGSRQGPALAGVMIARKSSRPLQPFHEAADYSAQRFQISRIHVRTSASKRGQLATVAVLPAPSSFFFKVEYLAHLVAFLKFVLSRKQTNSSEVFQNAGNDFHGRNR